MRKIYILIFILASLLLVFYSALSQHKRNTAVHEPGCENPVHTETKNIQRMKFVIVEACPVDFSPEIPGGWEM